MAPQRLPTSLPEPPWTQAPSEVSAWLSSTGTRRKARPSGARPRRLRGFKARFPVKAETRLFKRMSRMGLTEAPRPPAVVLTLEHLAHRGALRVLEGRVHGTQLRVEVHKRAQLELRVAFTPRLSLRRASKLLARLGIASTDGTWV